MALRVVWEHRFSQSSGCPVCLVTQLSADRLDRLVRLCERWDGPVAAAVLAPEQGEAAVRSQLRELSARARPQPIALRLLRPRSASRYYPVNAMRNAALEIAAPCPFVLVSDVDLLPSRGLLSELGMAANLAGWLGPNQSLCGPPLSALVVPSLEPCGAEGGEDGVGAADFDVDQAREALRAGRWRPFCWAQFPAGHRSTDFSRWLRAGGEFAFGPVGYEEGFEPFCVLPREALPPFDERLSGYGRNKCLFYLHLHSLGCAFFVLGRGCLLHAPHPASESFALTFGEEGRREPGRAAEVIQLYESAKEDLLRSSPAIVYSSAMAASRGSSLASYDRAARAEASAALQAPPGASPDGRLPGGLWLDSAEQRLCLHGLFAVGGSIPSAQDAGARRLSSRAEVNSNDVTWVTHCTQDRLPQLRAALAAWGGPLAAAVLARGGGHSWASLLREADEIVTGRCAQDRRVDLLLLPAAASSSRSACFLPFLPFPRRRAQKSALEGDALYPANSMRQIARGLAATKLAMLADVDFLPSQGLAVALAAEGPSLLGKRRFMVVPSFEMVAQEEEGVPAASPEALVAAPPPFEEVRRAASRGSLRGFHTGHFPQGHAPTDFGRWLELGGVGVAYEVAWEEGFEPYGVADLSLLPPYDVRFDAVFPMHDKESFFMELALGKEPFSFSVLPRGFLLSMAPPSGGRACSSIDRASPASRCLARALARRKAAELRWAGAAPAIAAGLFPRGCDCPAHARGAGPPFICSPGAAGSAEAAEGGAEVKGALGAAEPALTQQWELPPERILEYASRGIGRMRLDGEHGPAYLKGQAPAAGLRLEEDALAVRLARDDAEGHEPFRVRLDVPDAPWLEHRMRVVLRGGAERCTGRLPGLRMQLPWGTQIFAAFKWDPGGWGGYWAEVAGDAVDCSFTHLGKRPFQLGAAISQLSQRVEVVDGGRRCLISASVNGIRVFRASAERPEPVPAGGLNPEAASEGQPNPGNLAAISPDLCAFLKGSPKEGSRNQSGPREEAEVLLSSIVISAGIKV